MRCSSEVQQGGAAGRCSRPVYLRSRDGDGVLRVVAGGDHALGALGLALGPRQPCGQNTISYSPSDP